MGLLVLNRDDKTSTHGWMIWTHVFYYGSFLLILTIIVEIIKRNSNIVHDVT